MKFSSCDQSICWELKKSGYIRQLAATLLAMSPTRLREEIFSARRLSPRRWLCLLAILAGFAFAGQPLRADPPRNLPTLEAVMAFVDRHFANTTDFEAGDILSTSNVAPLFDGLELIGWDVPNRKALLDLTPRDNDYVVKQLRTEPGRKFMRHISKYPLAYDRLYHLVKIPLGRQQIHDLIRAKDGYQMIEYMTTTQQGKNLGAQLSHSPHGANFNQPTGQIFTVAALKTELAKSYSQTEKALAASKP